MESAGVLENSSLGLFYSETDPLHTLEENDLLAGLDNESLTSDLLHYLEMFHDAEEKQYEDAWYLCSNTEEYSKIDIIAEYVLENKKNGQLEDILDGIGSDGKECFMEQKIKKGKKRSFLANPRTQSDASQPKRRKQADLGLKTRGALVKIKPYPQNGKSAKGRGSFPSKTCSRRILSPPTGPLPPAPVQVSLASISPARKAFITPVPSASSRMAHSTRPIHIMPTFTSLPQQIISLSPGNTLSHFIICTTPPAQRIPEVTPVFPVSVPGDPTASSIPASPDRRVSSSPFAPSAAELPNLPEPASVHHCGRTDVEVFSHQTQAYVLNSEQAVENPKSVDAFCTLLKEHFRDTCRFLTKEGNITLDSRYTEVSLVESQIETKAGKGAMKGMEKELIFYDSPEKERASLEGTHLLKVARGKLRETKKIALLGQAGMGKSVLVKKICQDWSNGKFSEFKFVFCFKCRELNLPGKQYNLKDLLFQLFVKPQENSEEVFKYILHNPDRVLLLFDGFDEFQDGDGLMHCSLGPNAEKSHTIKELLAGLFQKKLLRGCTMLITARPKDKFNQYLTRVDKIVEVVGFSPQQIEEYLEKHFKKLSHCIHAVRLIKECQYLFSYCYNPFLCNLICCVCEKKLQAGQKLPLTLASLFLQDLQQTLVDITMNPSSEQLGNEQCIAQLAHVALTLLQKHQHGLRHNQFPSEKVKDFALNHGFILPFPTHPENACEEHGGVFYNSIAQTFWGALHLTLSADVKVKNLIRHISLEARKKRPQDSWQDMIRRFLTGLLFLDLDLNFDLKRGIKSIISAKQKMVSKYVKELEINELSPCKLLELCHCVYETQNSCLLQHITSKLPAELSFLAIRLTPPDVCVLQYILKRSAKKFFLDLRNSAIDFHGLKQLVSLDNVVLFRASLSDTVRLLESLQQTGEHELLRQSIEKFTIDPFKAKTVKDITDLTALVHTQEKMCNCVQDISEIPAVGTLKKLEFALGPIHGPEGFLKFVEILPAFSSLQHLDLDENNIGNKGAEKLSEAFPKLTLLKMLNLSQNNITDEGAKQLSKGFPSLSSLQTLSLYNNYICDDGAENIAAILPDMKSLKELALQYNKITDLGAQKLTESLRRCPQIASVLMWSPTIPHSVLEHLQQQDSRIKF